MKNSFKERIWSNEDLEIWQSKYIFKSWIAPCKLINTKTNTIYYKGDLCFALIGVIDEEGKMSWVNELQYFQRY